MMESTLPSSYPPEIDSKYQHILKLKITNNIGLEEYQASLSMSSLIKLGALNNSWVCVTIIRDITSNDDDEVTETHCNKRKHLLQLKALDCLSVCESESNNTESDVLSVNSELGFNICEENIGYYCSLCRGDHVTVHVELYSNMSIEIPMSRKISIAQVKSPDDTTNSDFDDALTLYFKKKRLLKVGYQFYIEVDKTNYAQAMRNNNKTGRSYKVLEMESLHDTFGFAWVNSKESSLFVKGSTNGFVRSNSIECGKVEGDVSFICGLEKYLFELHNLIQPSLLGVPPSENTILVHGQAGVGKRTIIRKLCEDSCMHVIEENCFNIIGDSISAMEQRIQNLLTNAVDCAPSILLLRNAHALCRDKDGTNGEPRLVCTFSKCLSEIKSNYPVIVIATTNAYKELSEEISSCFMYEYEVNAPDELERQHIITGLATCLGINLPSTLIAKKTAGFVLGDICSLISQIQSCALNNLPTQKEQDCSHLSLQTNYSKESIYKFLSGPTTRGSSGEDLTRDLRINQEDIDTAVDIVRSNRSIASDLPKIPEVSWSDVGGLSEVKSVILDTIQLPLEHPELVSSGLSRSGLLLYGPPGCGKTLLAKAVATEFSLNFLNVKGPELINMYVGQSEENVREVFKKGRQAAPCVIFFDELDSLAPNRGKSGDSGGVMDRVVSQLLAELDGMQTNNNLFVIGATNRPDLIDPALLRPGRFDRIVFVGHPDTKEDRLRMLLALTRKMHLSEDVLFEDIESKCPSILTGADFYALCSDAVLNAIRRRIEDKNSNKNICCKNENTEPESLKLVMDDFLEAINNLVPSLSLKDLSKYREFKSKSS